MRDQSFIVQRVGPDLRAGRPELAPYLTRFTDARRVARVACLVLALATAGCSIPIPQAEKDPTRYYVLSSSTSPSGAAAGSAVIELRPVEVANYLRARPMIVRRGNHEIEFREFARWGEPLESGLGRVLREELLARGAARAVMTAGLRRDAAPDAHVQVRVLECEGSVNGEVQFRAIWELSPAGDNSAGVTRGDFRATGLRWDGKTEGSLAAGLSQAVAGLAGEIAGAVKK